MTKKQMRKIAKELCELELAHRNTNAQDEIAKIEQKIMQITTRIFTSPDGMETMAEIDEMVQDMLSNS